MRGSAATAGKPLTGRIHKLVKVYTARQRLLFIPIQVRARHEHRYNNIIVIGRGRAVCGRDGLSSFASVNYR